MALAGLPDWPLLVSTCNGSAWPKSTIIRAEAGRRVSKSLPQAYGVRARV
jgi:hypothetical protein